LSSSMAKTIADGPRVVIATATEPHLRLR